MATRPMMVICPRCNNLFDANEARIASLSISTRRVWEAAGSRFQHGFEMIGPTEIARRLGKSQSTISYHLDMLVSEGLAVRVPLNRYKRVKHLYMGTLHSTVVVTF
jgi:DNA-binding MarR family transcriptional regulator